MSAAISLMEEKNLYSLFVIDVREAELMKGGKSAGFQHLPCWDKATFAHRVQKQSKKLKFPIDICAIRAIIQKLSDSAIEFGGIAQLGERLNGIQEVSGSIPLISTTKYRKHLVFGTFSLSFWQFCPILERFQNPPRK